MIGRVIAAVLGSAPAWAWNGGLFVAGALALVGLRAWDISTQQAKGAEKAVAKIEKATDNASKLGKRSADRSTADSVRGERDPSTRHD